ncbi:unnamed protein product [Eretmochelys imbricata]
MANNACQHSEDKTVVCLLKLHGGLFIVVAIDSIDHNPSSTTATDSSQGTGTSRFQHPSTEVEGVVHRIPTLDCETAASVKKSISSLPESYRIVLPLILKKINAAIPDANVEMKTDCQLITQGDRRI